MARTPVSTIAQYAPCVIYVRGQVTFSRIASHVEGEELARQNQIAASKGRLPHAKPYTSIAIKNPTIVDNGKLPAQVKQVIQERFYTKQDGTTAFTQESKSPFLPIVVYSNLAGELAGQGIADNNVPLPAELAPGLDVTIGVSLYSKNGFSGLGIKYVLINEPIKYYSNSALANDLAEAGITYVAPMQQTQQPMMEAEQPSVNTMNNYQQPQTNNYQQYTQPVQQQVQQQPVQQTVQQTQPVNNAAWMQDSPFQNNVNNVPQQEQTIQRPNRFY